MKYYVMIILIPFYFHSFGQKRTKQSNNYGMVYLDFEYNEVKGSPYLIEDWSVGSIEMINDLKMEDLKLKLDLLKGELILLKNTSEITVPKNRVKSFTIDVRGTNLIYIQASIEGTEQYVQVLFEGLTHNLLLFPRVIYSGSDLNQAYSAGQKESEYKRTNQFFIQYANGNIDELRQSRNGLIRHFPDHHDELKSFISTNSLNPKATQDLIKVFEYYEHEFID